MREVDYEERTGVRSRETSSQVVAMLKEKVVLVLATTDDVVRLRVTRIYLCSKVFLISRTTPTIIEVGCSKRGERVKVAEITAAVPFPPRDKADFIAPLDLERSSVVGTGLTRISAIDV